MQMMEVFKNGGELPFVSYIFEKCNEAIPLNFIFPFVLKWKRRTRSGKRNNFKSKNTQSDPIVDIKENYVSLQIEFNQTF
jgi:hypothetical protein